MMPRERSDFERWLIVAIVLGLVVIIGYKTSSKDEANSISAAATDQTESAADKKLRLATAMRLESGILSGRIMAASELQTSFPESPEAQEAGTLLPELREAYRVERIGTQWQYFNREDEMTGKAFKNAVVKSSNTHSFDFPYAGAQNATLALRKHPRHGADVIFSIEKGQLQCRSYSGCSVLVRFGDGEPGTYTANGPEDNSSTSLFIGRYADFVKRMSQVDIIRIQANVYQYGAPTWEFDVSGFKSEMMR